MSTSEPFTFRVVDLKQYIYCPRILYYQTVLPEIRPITYKMEAGIAAHQLEEGREKRRSLRTYGVQTGARHFNAPLFSVELGLSGEIDLLIETADEYIPVDYKAAKIVGAHYKLQLMAYGRLVELVPPNGPKPVTRGFLYLIPQRTAVAVSFTRRLRSQLDEAISQLQTIARAQRMPEPTAQPRRCVDCEFRRFCNDVA